MKNFITRFARSRGAVYLGLFAVAAEVTWFVATGIRDAVCARQSMSQEVEDDPYRMPVVPPVAHPESESAKAWEAGAPTERSEYWDWRDRRTHEALARRKTVPGPDSSWSTPIPDDDSLTAYFWRRYQFAIYQMNCVSTQFELNVCSSQADVSLEWMVDAMVAEIHLLYDGYTEFLEALDASQRAWVDFAEKQQAMRYPPSDRDYGSSSMMVWHEASIPVRLRRVQELLPWVMGVDSSEGQWMGMGSLSYDDEIAYGKEELRAFGLWPLRPENIGADTAYGDRFLYGTEGPMDERYSESTENESDEGSTPDNADSGE